MIFAFSAFLRGSNLLPNNSLHRLIIRPNAAAQFFLFPLLGFGIEHLGLGAAGATALLAANLFEGLLLRAFFTELLFLDLFA